MNRIRFLRPSALALALALALPALAQNEIVASPNPDADRLARQVRTLASDPRDVTALLDAGDLSARLGDTAAALAFFARAEAIDPANPRILSGRAATLVRLERPGEALRLFQTAEARGLRVSQHASDRGLAYDLLGSPDLAQRDYQTALGVFRDDETVRRYALSLGITGDVDEAMKQLDPLLRRTDRAAWRARAFILAMNGDVVGADRIAASMMPGSMGSSLAPFFRRLQGLSPADRAFAVHFGELSPTQARLADARMAPVLPRYVPQSRRAEVAAVAAPAKPQPEAKRDRRSRRERERDARRDAALAEAARRQPVQVAQAQLPPPPAYVERSGPIVQPLPTPTPTPAPAPAPVRFASRTFAPPPERASVVQPLPTPAPTPTPAPVQLASRTTFAPPAEPLTVATVPPAAQPEPMRAMPAPEALPVTPAATSAPQALPTPEATPVAEAAIPAPAPPGAARPGEEDSVLAAIISRITIPGEELAAVTAPATAPVAAEPAPVAATMPEPVRIAELAPAAKARPAPAKAKVEPKVEPKPEPKPEPKTVAKIGAKPDPKAKKPDPKAAAKADAKAKKPDLAKAEPSRTWVQVAGGANPASLAKAWAAVVAKAPAVMKGKSAWSAPLRATNRVLAGPFKSGAEAQSFVNALGKAGVSAFVFTSDAGEKITRLSVK